MLRLRGGGSCVEFKAKDILQIALKLPKSDLIGALNLDKTEGPFGDFEKYIA